MKIHGDHKIFLEKKYDNAGQCRNFLVFLQDIHTLKNRTYSEKMKNAGQSRTLVQCDTTKNVIPLVLNMWWYNKIFSYENSANMD